MLLRILKDNHTSGMIVIIILMVIFSVTGYLNFSPPGEVGSMPLYNFLFQNLQNSRWGSVVISSLIIGIILVALTRLNISNFLLEDRSFMPAALYLFILGSFPSASVLNPVLVVTVFILLAFLGLLKGEEHRANPIALFNAGILIAIGSLFYLKIIWYIPFFWIAVAMIRPLKWRGIINPFLAFIVLGLFYIGYYWIFKDDLHSLPGILRTTLSGNGTIKTFSVDQWIMISYIFLLTFIASFYLMTRFTAKKNIIRKIYQVLFVLFLYTLAFYFFISGRGLQLISVLAIPLSMLLSNYFHRRKTQWFHELLLLVWLGLIIFVQLRY